MIDPATAGALAGLLGAFVGAIGTWMVKRVEKAPDMQAALATAVSGVIEHYTKAMDRNQADIECLREQINELQQHIDRLSEVITAHGLAVPKRRPKTC
jgi:TolA-binding protein